MLKPKFTNSTDFSKNVNKEPTKFFQKQVIFFFTVVFYPMIHNIYLKDTAPFTTFFRFSFTFLKSEVKILL